MSTNSQKIFLYNYLIWCDDIDVVRHQQLNDGFTEVYSINTDKLGIFACEKDGTQKIFVRDKSQLPILHLNSA
jgi:hypothetical protein